MEEKPRLLILYASQTGNALDAAERVGREAERRGCHASVLSMDEFDSSRLPYEDTIIFVVSTTGQGDTPETMKVFWRFLLQRNLSRQWLEGVHYAVFGLGDSGYQKYNFAAKKLDKRLVDLGASPIIERGLGDDQHPSGYEGALDPWLSSLWNMLRQTNPVFSRGLQINDLNVRTLDCPKYQITCHTVDEMQAMVSNTSDLKCIEMQIGRARSMSPGVLSRDDNRPQCFLQMTKNQLLTKAGCGRDVRHFEFEPLLSHVEYQVGDVLEVLPSQDPTSVDAFIQRCNLNPDTYIRVQPRSVEEHLPDTPNVLRDPVKLRTFVELTMDIASASPRRYFFEAR